MAISSKKSWKLSEKNLRKTKMNVLGNLISQNFHQQIAFHVSFHLAHRILAEKLSFEKFSFSKIF